MRAAPAWGTRAGTFDAFALVGAERVVRLLLPAPSRDTERTATWAEVAAASRAPVRVDGYTCWSELTELPGGGDAETFEHPAGRVPEPVLGALVAAVESGAGAEARAVAERPPGASARGAPLTAVGAPLAPSRPVPPPPAEGRLRDLAVGWATRFAGRVWTVDGRTGIAAPQHADSLVVSGPRALHVALLRAGLEAHPVARSAPCPITTD
ncbi:MAG: hypothetical protein M3P46_05065 [Actinomycetota bacterium]|nr:hypothetical protein [Actinomycetota bacterium]